MFHGAWWVLGTYSGKPMKRETMGFVVPCAGLSLKLQMKVISGSGYLKKIQRTGWFPQRTN
jgi:hypothetical protein